MAREVPNTISQPQRQGGGGGLLRSLLRPFMPQVATGIDIASGLLHGNGDAMSKGLAQATQMLGGDNPQKKAAEKKGTVDPGPIPETNPVLASAEDPSQDVGEEEGEELSPDQMAALRHLDSQFPGLHTELQEDPGLLDGASNMVNKLRYMYRRQPLGGVQA